MDGFTQLAWLESLRLGHEVIDRDHEELLDLAGEALEAALDRGDRAEALSWVRTLNARFTEHARYEEDLLREVAEDLGALEVAYHVEGHRTVQADLAALEAYLETGGDVSGSAGLRWQALQGLLKDLVERDSALVGALIKVGRYRPGAA